MIIITYIVVAFMFFAIGTTFADLWAENKDIPLSDQLALAKHEGECKKKREIIFFTNMVIRELKKDLSKGYPASYYYKTLWWRIKNADVAKEVSENVSRLTGLNFTHAPHSVGEYSIGCPDTLGKKES